MKPQLPPTPWTDEIVARMGEHLRAGRSTAATAERLNKEFGTVFSRNAVSGKIDRLGLRMGIKRSGVQKSQKVKPQRLVALEPKPKPAPVPAIPWIEPAGVPFDDLRLHQCRFEMGGLHARAEHFRFCAEPVVEGLSWCPHHLRIVSLDDASARRLKRNAQKVAA